MLDVIGGRRLAKELGGSKGRRFSWRDAEDVKKVPRQALIAHEKTKEGI